MEEHTVSKKHLSVVEFVLDPRDDDDDDDGEPLDVDVEVKHAVVEEEDDDEEEEYERSSSFATTIDEIPDLVASPFRGTPQTLAWSFLYCAAPENMGSDEMDPVVVRDSPRTPQQKTARARTYEQHVARGATPPAARTPLGAWLAARSLHEFEAALESIGAKRVADLAYLTDEDLEGLGFDARARARLHVQVVT